MGEFATIDIEWLDLMRSTPTVYSIAVVTSSGVSMEVIVKPKTSFHNIRQLGQARLDLLGVDDLERVYREGVSH